MNRLIPILMLFTAATTAEPVESACTSIEARQFDFYIGDWDIEQRIRRADDGWIELPASTSVTRAASGCALVERWQGEVQFFWTGMEMPAPLHGLSVRAWDPSTDKWNIHWLDSQNPVFGEPFSGRFTDGTGVFYHESDTRLARITFTNVTDTSLDWELAISTDGGERWRTLWTMAMTRKR